MRNDNGSGQGGNERDVKSDTVLDIFWIYLTDLDVFWIYLTDRREWEQPAGLQTLWSEQPERMESLLTRLRKAADEADLRGKSSSSIWGHAEFMVFISHWVDCGKLLNKWVWKFRRKEWTGNRYLGVIITYTDLKSWAYITLNSGSKQRIKKNKDWFTRPSNFIALSGQVRTERELAKRTEKLSEIEKNRDYVTWMPSEEDLSTVSNSAHSSSMVGEENWPLDSASQKYGSRWELVEWQ